jgi:hypothetical protein
VAADQQLLSAGVNDRNVEDFLGLIEQRIDDLIQVRGCVPRDVLVGFACNDTRLRATLMYVHLT